ncbi:DUF6299 family protein [Streptomyces laurentii]|uniref:DUF6299 family protein n=1 Tax=Streptomyces laurentii TaxID=39478 RepID=UPI0036C851C8
MRVRLALAAGVLATATAATALTGATATAAPARSANVVSVDRQGKAAKSGEVSVSGSYRCASGGSGPVFLGSTLVQQDRSVGIGGTRAVCDGRTHRWTHRSLVKQNSFKAGTARVEAVLVRLAPDGPLGLPLPVFLTRSGQSVSLR